MVKEDLFNDIKILVDTIFHYEENKSLEYTTSNGSFILELCNGDIKIGIYDNYIYLHNFSKCISSTVVINGTDYLNDIIRFSKRLHKIIETIQYIAR